MQTETKVLTLTEWDNRFPIPEKVKKLLDSYDTQISLTSPKNKPRKRGDSTLPFGFEGYEGYSDLTEDFESVEQIRILQEAISFEERVQTALDGVIKNAKDYEKNIKQIEDIKSSVIDKISKFYSESSKLLDQQKTYVDTGVHVQTILMYFQDYEKLAKDVENLSMNIANIHIYEPNIQRFLSEIMDAIEFFESKPNYLNSSEYVEKYDKLKKRLLSIIKNMFIKIFTRDYNEISKVLDKFSYETLEIPANKDVLFNVSANTELMKIIFPEFNSRFSGTPYVEHPPDGRHVSKILKDLLNYMKLLTNFDPDCNDTLYDLFSSYYGTFRKNIQNKILGGLFTQIHRMPQKELQRIMGIIITYALQMSFFELLYHNNFFNNSVALNESSPIGEIIVKVMDDYYEYIFGFIQMEHNIQNIFEAIDALNYYIDPRCLDVSPQAKVLDEPEEEIKKDDDGVSEREKNILGGILDNIDNGASFQDLVNIQKKIKEKDQTNFERFVEIYVDFLRKIKGEINKKLTDMIQYYIDKQLLNFNLNQYWKEFNQKYNSNPDDFRKGDVYKSPYFRTDMKAEFFPMTRKTVELLFNLKHRIEPRTYQDIANQMITACMNYMYLTSDLFVEKTDSFLFLIKNFVYFNNKLEDFGVELTIDDEKESKEAGILEKIKLNMPLFGGKKTSQKMQDLGCELKMPPHEHLVIICKRFVSDIEFIISIKLVEYLKRYQDLQKYLQENEELSPEGESKDNQNSPSKDPDAKQKTRNKSDYESAQKDLNLLLSKDMIKKYYIMFTQNMEDMLQDLSIKVLNYIDNETFRYVKGLVEEMVSNLMQMLSNFYIVVSEHHPDTEVHNEFKFVDIGVYSTKLLGYFGIQKQAILTDNMDN
mgnify:CR=1 FL=1